MKMRGVTFLALSMMALASFSLPSKKCTTPNVTYADDEAVNLTGEITVPNESVIRYTGEVGGSVSFYFQNTPYETYTSRDVIELTLIFDNLILYGDSETGKAFTFINETLAPVNIHIVLSGDNSVYSKSSSQSPFMLIGDPPYENTDSSISIYFEMANPSCQETATLTFGLENGNNESVQTIFRYDCIGQTFCTGCKADNSYSDSFEIDTFTKAKRVVFTGDKIHNYNEQNIISASQPTCTSNGWNEYLCSDCSSYIRVPIPMVDHTFDMSVAPIVTQKTCTRGGTTTRKCTVCGQNIVVAKDPATGHDWNIETVIQIATCCAPGLATGTCNVCGAQSSDIELDIDPNNHTDLEYDYTYSMPTCTEDGIDVYYCSACHQSEERTVSKIGGEHVWSDWVKECDPICCENGLYVRQCSRCLCNETKEIPSTGEEHSYTQWITVTEATCTEDGLEECYCDYCENRITRIIHATGHNWMLVQTTEEPTCAKPGVGTFVCGNCKIFDEHEISNEDIAHTWGDWDRKVQPDCINDGLDERTCSVCGKKETNVIEAGDHNYVESEIIEPTCCHSGKIIYVCTGCGEKIEEELDIEPFNHEGVKQLVIDIPATENDPGRGHFEWSCCGYKSYDEVVDVSLLTAESSKEVLSNIIGLNTYDTGEVPEGKESAKEAIDGLSDEKALEVAGEANKTFEEINSLNIDEDTKDEYVQSILAATESAVIAGSKLDNSEEEAQKIKDKMPKDSSIDVNGKLSNFYKLQYDLILGKTTDSTSRSAYKAPDNNVIQSAGIDYTEDAQVYKKVDEFIDNTVEHMTGALSMVRVCSNEKISSLVNDYIDQIGVRSFKNFDKRAADLEFAQNTYKAMLINMQTQTIANLKESYEKLAKTLSGTALKDLQNEYNSQLEVCNDIDKFEWVLIEIMRQKYNSILNTKLDKKEITYEFYSNNFIGDTDNDLVNFKDTYLDIFYCWALGEDAGEYGYTNEYGITLQELTDAVISSTTFQKKEVNLEKGPSTSEIVVAVVFGTLSLLTAAALIVVEIIKRRRVA